MTCDLVKPGKPRIRLADGGCARGHSPCNVRGPRMSIDASEEMEAAGVNMDGSEHSIALRLRGQAEPVVIKLADGEKSRL